MNIAFPRILTAALLSLTYFTSVSAQEKPEFSLKTDIVSANVWRGSLTTGFDGANIQPDATLSYAGFSLDLWSSVNFSGTAKECDFLLGYTTGALSFLITDYWWGGPYFRYGKGAGTHTFEGSVACSLGETFPLSLSWNTLFYGNDYKADGSKQYSTYVEATYETHLGRGDGSLSDVGLTFSVGVSPWTSTWYHCDPEGNMKSGFQVVNVALIAAKELKITDLYSLPVFGKIVVNPSQEDINFVVGFSL